VHIGNALYVAGAFLKYRGQSANFIAKIDMSTCALDTTFSPPANNGFDHDVRKIVTDGTAIYAVGTFTAYRGSPVNYFAKIDASTGALDDAFMNPVGVISNGFSNETLDIRIHGSDVYVGGVFSAYRGVANSARGIARLNAVTGNLISTFGPVDINNGFNSSGSPAGVSSIALNADGSVLYAAGSFNEYRNGATTVAAMRIARISLEDGSASTTFSPPSANGFDNNINVLEFTDGALFVGGAFDVYRGTLTAHRIAKLDATSGALDLTFNPQGASPTVNGFEGNITAIVGIGGSIIVGGQPLGGYRSPTDLTTGLAKLDTSSGDLDPAFMTPSGHDRAGFEDASYTMRSVRVVGSTLWIGGNFKLVGGRSANRIARVKDEDGSLDSTFSPPLSNGFDGDVAVLAASADALYVGGSFSTYRGQPSSASCIAKLDPTTGALDTTFSPAGPTANGFDGRVEALLHDSGTLHVGGSFSAYRGIADSASSIAKLDAQSGAIDTTFSPPGSGLNGFDDTVYAIAKRGNDLFVGGDFVAYRGGNHNSRSIAKLDAATGELNTTFSPPVDNGFDSTVLSLLTLGNSLFVGGDFYTYRATTDVGNLVKIDADTGALDTTFSTPGPAAGFDNSVQTLVVSGASLYAGGRFLSYGGVLGSANFLAKLDPETGALDTGFTPSGATSGYGSIEVLAAHHDAIFAGGDFANCEAGVCYQNANRFSRDTRTLK
jgi:Domain of unknown function (DUF5122) beta-propeller